MSEVKQKGQASPRLQVPPVGLQCTRPESPECWEHLISNSCLKMSLSFLSVVFRSQHLGFLQCKQLQELRITEWFGLQGPQRSSSSNPLPWAGSLCKITLREELILLFCLYLTPQQFLPPAQERSELLASPKHSHQGTVWTEHTSSDLISCSHCPHHGELLAQKVDKQLLEVRFEDSPPLTMPITNLTKRKIEPGNRN